MAELLKRHLLRALCPKELRKWTVDKDLLALGENDVDVSGGALLPNHFAVLAQLRKVLVIDLICTFCLRRSCTLESRLKYSCNEVEYLNRECLKGGLDRGTHPGLMKKIKRDQKEF